MKQIFIFSLPRSGSTLLQRVLMTHNQISSTAETWLLLPQIYAIRNSGQLSEYGSLPASRAINDLIENLPNKKEDYYSSLRNFISEIHQKLSFNNESYFLDKTPRYYLIIKEIAELFPEAKFIFLFRSPEQIYSSMLNTWGKNRFKYFLSSYHDLIDGFSKLSSGYELLKEKSISLNYEDFVISPEESLNRLMKYLDLEFDKNMIESFSSQNTKGRLGDPTGVKNYSKISKDSINKWRTIYSTRFRKRVGIKIISKINSKALDIQGYNKKNILKELKEIKTNPYKIGLQDLKDYYLDFLIRKFNLQTYFSKDFKWSRKKYLS